ncbi:MULTISPECIES: glycosyltransferase [unclassified Pseudomonas]|uniref:glycosyltransferase family 4 protein n=1 Tax=unclassified Pseudomonas TaxID=196821 RepID=UPI00100D29E6|nr:MULTISPECIES: glycosyltransferase [unclassified Pseudomonas]MCE5981069.1 glycosyltransferase [Pseudomonas sp. LF19]SPO69001.1 Glycosyltransferase [Pseudomonas sp. JV241A]
MNIVNIMWAGGSPYVSVHKVHQQILSQAEPGTKISSWLLQGQGSCCGAEPTREWHLSHRLLKGRHIWGLLRPWLHSRFRAALEQADAHVLVLDGLGVSRLLLPVVQKMPGVQTAIVFHGKTRLRRADIAMLRACPCNRLSIVAVSQTLAITLEQDLGMPVQVLRTALDPEVFRRGLLNREQARLELDLPVDGVRVMGAMGRLVDSKGFDYLLEAFALASQDRPDLRLVILGEGNQRPLLESRVKALGLGDKVSLPGHCTGLAQLYRAFDWVLIPSHSEGLGLVLQEAVMAAVPVLCSELPVFREQLGGAGCYAPAGDPVAWAKAIIECTGQPAHQVAMSQWQALAPDQAWQSFSQASRALLRNPREQSSQ